MVRKPKPRVSRQVRGRTRRGWWPLALLVTLAACGAAQPSASHTRGLETLSFSLPNTQGQQVSPADFAGRVVLVDIWATWCKPCMLSLPFYADLHERYEAQGLTILGVNIDEEAGTLAEYLVEHPLPFTVLRDPQSSLPASLDVETMPTSVLIGRDGRVLYVHDGFDDGEQVEVEERVVAALGGTSQGQ
ncbi:MAG: TlpA family protein disulfide reductase [Deltaproteobacteria bacterium]|nr:TlpA family protein disulfide reductase [Deltaproteobacteria bacterium]